MRRCGLVGAGMHQVVRSIASGRHYGSSDAYPLIPGVDAVARGEDGALVYTGWPRAPWGTMAELLATPLGVPLPSAFQTGAADPLAVAAGMNPAMSGWMPLTTHREARGRSARCSSSARPAWRGSWPCSPPSPSGPSA